MTGLTILLFTIIFLFVLSQWRTRKEALTSLGLAILVILTAGSMILYPEPSFKAAERGLNVWWNIVLPALLPFFIAAELLMGMGVVHFMGVLMEPLMRPVFNVPGTGAFVMAMGIASGYPLGASLAARLKADGLASKTEAERLMCFSNTSDPLFMTGAVAVGMFKRVDLGVIIISAHYLSALTLGLLLRFWRKGQDQSKPTGNGEGGFIILRAYRAMRKAQKETEKPFGELLGEAVKRSVNTLLLILGFIVLFSVIFEILKMAGFTAFLSRVLTVAVPDFLIPKALHDALVSGFFEITIGASMCSQANASLIARVATAGAIIAWSGLSVHAQVAAVIQSSGLSVWPYTASRVFQGVLAMIYTYLLMSPRASQWALPAFEPSGSKSALSFFASMGESSLLCILLVGSLAVVSLSIVFLQAMKKNLPRPRFRI